MRPIWRDPHLVNVEPPRPRIEAIRIVDMSSSNSWAEFAAIFHNTREVYLEHERAKTELKALLPEDAKEGIGHGLRARRSKTGAILDLEAAHAPVSTYLKIPDGCRSAINEE